MVNILPGEKSDNFRLILISVATGAMLEYPVVSDFPNILRLLMGGMLLEKDVS